MKSWRELCEEFQISPYAHWSTIAEEAKRYKGPCWRMVNAMLKALYDEEIESLERKIDDRCAKLENAQEAEFTNMQHADLKVRQRLDALERRMGEVEIGVGEVEVDVVKADGRIEVLEAHTHGQSNAWLEGKLQTALEAIAELKSVVDDLCRWKNDD